MDSDAASLQTGTDFRRPAVGARTWAVAAGLTVLGVAAMPFDGAVSEAVRSIPLGGDPKRELEVLQQWGAPASLVIAGWSVWLAMPGKRRQLLDWLAAAGLTWLATQAFKMLLGRARPRDHLQAFYDHTVLLGPTGAHPLGGGEGFVYPWQFWTREASDFWSMPSSHTSMAVSTSVALWVLCPKLWPLLLTLACLVGFSRVYFGAHWPSDVLVGAALGLVVTTWIMRRGEQRGA